VWRENWFFLILLSLTSASIIILVDVVSSKLVDCMIRFRHLISYVVFLLIVVPIRCAFSVV
jgi:hypothetical protein